MTTPDERREMYLASNGVSTSASIDMRYKGEELREEWDRLVAFFETYEPRTAQVIRNGWNEERIASANLDAGFGGRTATVDEFIRSGDEK